MKTEEILNLNYSLPSDKEKIQKALRLIKPLSKYDFENDIDLELLEKVIGVYERKYAFQLDYITPTFCVGEQNVFSATIRNVNTGKHLKYIFGSTIYELFAKICIYYYSLVKNGIEEKDWDEMKKRRVKDV